MGINICLFYRIHDSFYELPHAIWDSCRYGGDTEFVEEVLYDKTKSTVHVFMGDAWYRPIGDAWREWSKPTPYNVNRWAYLSTLVESNSDFYVGVF